MKAETVGSASLVLLGLTLALLKVWRLWFGYPAEAEVAALLGTVRLNVSALDKLWYALFGFLGLAGLVSADRLPYMLSHLHKPILLIKDSELRKALCRPWMCLVSLALFAIAIDVASGNVSVTLLSKCELIVRADLLTGEPAIAAPTLLAKTRLEKDKSARVLLRGRTARVFIVLRDKYNLRTLAGYELRRSTLGCDLKELRLFVDGEAQKEQSGAGVHVEGLTLRVTGRLPLSNASVATGYFEPRVEEDEPVSDARECCDAIPLSFAKACGELLVGDTEDGPEKPLDAQKTWGFFERLWDARSEMAAWDETPSYLRERTFVADVAIPDYHLRISSRPSELKSKDGEESAKLREAVQLSAMTPSPLMTFFDSCLCQKCPVPSLSGVD